MANEETIVYRKEFDKFPELIVSNNQFKRHIQELADYLLLNENFNICLCEAPIIHSAPSVHCWCKKNEFLIIFDNNSISKSKSCSDTSFINSICNTLEEHFLYSPEHLKSKEFISHFLRNL